MHVARGIRTQDLAIVVNTPVIAVYSQQIVDPARFTHKEELFSRYRRLLMGTLVRISPPRHWSQCLEMFFSKLFNHKKGCIL